MRIRIIGSLLLLLGAVGAALGSEGEVPYPEACTELGCLDTVSYEGKLAVTAKDLPQLKVRLCRNNTCVDTRPRGQGDSYECNGPATFNWSCHLTVQGDGVQLRVDVGPNRGPKAPPLRDGDRYRLTITGPDRKPLVNIDQQARYFDVRPNGPRCAPVCRQATLTNDGSRTTKVPPVSKEPPKPPRPIIVPPT